MWSCRVFCGKNKGTGRNSTENKWFLETFDRLPRLESFILHIQQAIFRCVLGSLQLSVKTGVPSLVSILLFIVINIRIYIHTSVYVQLRALSPLYCIYRCGRPRTLQSEKKVFLQTTRIWLLLTHKTASVYSNMGDYSKVLSFYERAMDIGQQSFVIVILYFLYSLCSPSYINTCASVCKS
jgi:hypothetical protein